MTYGIPHTDIVYLLWSNKHRMWWRPNSAGYTSNEAEAGRYSEHDALERVRNSAACGILAEVTCMVADRGAGGRS